MGEFGEDEAIGFTKGTFGVWDGTRTTPANGWRWTAPGEFRLNESSETKRNVDSDLEMRWLIPVDEEFNFEKKYLNSLDETGRTTSLHREFAAIAELAISKQPAAALAFANEYGNLSRSHLYWLVTDTYWDIHHGGGSGSNRSAQGEPWSLWQEEFFRLAALVKIWDRVRAGDDAALADYIKWSAPPNRVATFVCFGRKHRRGFTLSAVPLVDAEDTESNPDSWLQAGLVREIVDGSQEKYPDRPRNCVIALRAVQQSVNARLIGGVTAQLRGDDTGNLWYVPDSLLTALYLHFALEISGRKRDLKQCANPACNTWFQPRHGKQIYCDKPDIRTCRNAVDYSKRKAVASRD